MDSINYKEFQKMDLRVGTVTKAEVPAWSHWVMKLTVNFGDELGEKTIFSGIMHHYKPEDLEGKQFIFIINLEPKKIGPEGDYSNGMMLMAADKMTEPIIIEGEEEYERPILISPVKKVPNGTVIL